jgi:hypothetical protein
MAGVGMTTKRWVGMKTSLFLNYMGPYNGVWLEKNVPYKEVTMLSRFTNKPFTYRQYLKHYAMGRIDYYMDENDLYGSSISVPIMEAESWTSFGEFLNGMTIESDLVNLDYLVSLYEEQTGEVIVWFDNK